jgi:hypothetical protein
MRTYERMTGPMTHKRLVETAGVVIIAIGGWLAASRPNRQIIS